MWLLFLRVSCEVQQAPLARGPSKRKSMRRRLACRVTVIQKGCFGPLSKKMIMSWCVRERERVVTKDLKFKFNYIYQRSSFEHYLRLEEEGNENHFDSL